MLALIYQHHGSVMGYREIWVSPVEATSPAESIRYHTVASPLKILGKSTDKMPWGILRIGSWWWPRKTHQIGIRAIETGWWFQPTPLKNDRVKVSWDDEIPKMMGKLNFMFQITNQEIIGRWTFHRLSFQRARHGFSPHDHRNINCCPVSCHFSVS